MSQPIQENVHTNSFTPREYLVDLIETSKKQNTIIFCNTSATKGFLSLKIVQEFAKEIRNGKKKCLFIMCEFNVPILQAQLKLLTDLDVWDDDPSSAVNEHSVLVISGSTCLEYLEQGLLDFADFRLVVIDDGLYNDDDIINRIVNFKKVEGLRILGLVSGLLTDDMQPAQLEAQMKR